MSRLRFVAAFLSVCLCACGDGFDEDACFTEAELVSLRKQLIENLLDDWTDQAYGEGMFAETVGSGPGPFMNSAVACLADFSQRPDLGRIQMEAISALLNATTFWRLAGKRETERAFIERISYSGHHGLNLYVDAVVGEDPPPELLARLGEYANAEEVRAARANVAGIGLCVMMDIGDATPALVKPYVPDLIRGLATDARGDRAMCAEVLRRIGADATAAIGALKDLANDQDAALAKVARAAVSEIEGEK